MIFQKNASERIEPQQVKQNVQQLVMQEHVGDQRPGPGDKLSEGGRQREPVNESKIFISTKKKNDRSEPNHYPDCDIDVYQLCQIRSMLIRKFYFVG